MTWKRKDQMTVKERNNVKNDFINQLKNDKNRKWKPVIIDGKESLYMISNDGILASLRMSRFMKPSTNEDGYVETVISHNGKRINVSLHRLVAEAFIPNPENKPEVNHKDGIKSNNFDYNLEWVSHYDNIIHAIKTGLRDNYLPEKRYKPKEIRKVCKLLEKGLSLKEISNKTGVSKGVIRSIRSGKAWKYISINYKIPNLNSKIRGIQIENKEQASTTTKSNSIIEEEFCFKWEL